MNKRQFICGRDCTLSLFQNNIHTPIPYTAETLRAEYSTTTGNTRITGCFITLLTIGCIQALIQILADSKKPFDLIMDRVQRKVVYRNVFVWRFEIRGRLHEGVYLRIDIRSLRDSHVDYTDTSPSIPWKKESLFYLRQNCWTGKNLCPDLTHIYLFTFSGDFTQNTPLSLSLHFPLSLLGRSTSGEILPNLILTLANIFTIEFTQLRILFDMTASSSSSELLISRGCSIGGTVICSLKKTPLWEVYIEEKQSKVTL